MASSVINSDDGLVSGTTGLKSSGGDDGVLNIQSNGSTVVAVDGSGVSVTGTLSSSGGYGAVSATTLTVNSNNISADNSLGFRNRIINGDMRIDQRNAGAVTTPASGPAVYTLDRWAFANISDAGVATVDQDTSAPTGFSYSYKVQTTTADATVAATDRVALVHQIEGFNTSDFGFGTASAKTVILSFWVRSSLTGTFGGNINNNGNTRSYIFNYTISTADTWEYKTITIPGDTSGTWVGATNGKGVGLLFSLMAGTDFQGTVNTWNAANVHNTSGAVNLLGTLNATWYITGVQLEVGSVATPFERRPYGTELSLCQRYFEKTYAVGTAPAAVTDNGMQVENVDDGLIQRVSIRYKVTKRDNSQTVTIYNNATGATASVRTNSGNNYAVGGAYAIGESGCFIDYTPAAGEFASFHWTVSSEL
jgi:hypothetical protein